ncbi:phage integrase N-terminal SAM-like domain-containing protein [Acidithiobacillus ferrivorans]|uniref:phage integrase N-terminal SAM-like domain-containing protein n=1 Tax=Acidithiobacillus ferrivorans TaxID=160808 RepID=UPI003AA99F87
MHYSIRTEEAYTDWARRFILFHQKRHPKNMGAAEVEAFLSHLATERSVSSSTQNQAKAALLFLYKQVLGIDLPWLDNITSAKPSQHLPVVLTPTETRALLHELSGTMWLVVWHRHAFTGRITPARKRHGVRVPRNYQPGWQRSRRLANIFAQNGNY